MMHFILTISHVINTNYLMNTYLLVSKLLVFSMVTKQKEVHKVFYCNH